MQKVIFRMEGFSIYYRGCILSPDETGRHHNRYMIYQAIPQKLGVERSSRLDGNPPYVVFLFETGKKVFKIDFLRVVYNFQVLRIFEPECGMFLICCDNIKFLGKF